MGRTGDEKIGLMHAEYGVLSGVTCKTCPHLEAHCNADCTRVWYKCQLFGVSSGPGTDWRIGNVACGGFKIDPDEAERKHLYGYVYRLVKGRRTGKREREIDGQITMAI